jgi:uncharacterized protein YigA (DUF484 family)
MTSSQQPQLVSDDTVEAIVIDYLVQNPQFFERHPELLAELRIPHPSGAAVSLLEHQTRILRERNRTLQSRLDELLAVARDNDRLADRMHRLTLELMEAHNLDSAIFSLKDELRSNFECDAVAIKLLGAGDGEDWVQPDSSALTSFSHILQEPRPVCGRRLREQLQFLVSDSAVAIGSAALVPLVDNNQVVGLLAVGSYRPDHFHPGMGTVFLRQLGAIAGRALRRHLPT